MSNLNSKRCLSSFYDFKFSFQTPNTIKGKYNRKNYILSLVIQNNILFSRLRLVELETTLPYSQNTFKVFHSLILFLFSKRFSLLKKNTHTHCFY